MADDVTSGEIRTRRFDVVRKGYDRGQVESFLAHLATRFDDLESRIAEVSDDDTRLGIDDPEALARELSAIGGEVDKILEAARETSETMRSRAAADAESWTTEATARNDASTSEAEIQVRTAREAAWVEGSAMLLAAVEEVERMVAETETETLRIRAEAEREAIRHTTDAKRAGEEVVGAAENEAEAIVASSRAESERVLRVANQSAELAQERARALEDRRTELLAELESTRSSIGDLETEIESKRQALEEPEPVAVPAYDDGLHHGQDGGSVRIVSGSKVVPLEPVDADSFVAEVAELHAARPSEDPDVSHQLSAVISESEEPQDSEVGAESSLDSPSQLAVGDAGAASVSPDPEIETDVDADRQSPVRPHHEDDGDDVGEREGGNVQSDDQPETHPEAAAEVDAIGSLFAQLRGDSQAEQPAADSRPPIVEWAEAVEETSEEVQLTEVVAPDDSLIPMQNRALRSIKRLLVDLQNGALEQLRIDKTWVPTEEFTDRFSEPFNDLAAAIVAGGDDGGAASVFATDLYDAVSNAVTTTRDAGSGERAIAAATSKVFRTWRSDEAERRVVAAATELSERT